MEITMGTHVPIGGIRLGKNGWPPKLEIEILSIQWEYTQEIESFSWGVEKPINLQMKILLWGGKGPTQVGWHFVIM
jgi:hypothetical protein